ncbi:GmrSD restriction endonuclease domain-containing protein [Methylobacterium sp. CM6241]
MAEDQISETERLALEEAMGVEDEPGEGEVDLIHPFDPSKIRVTTEPRTIDLLHRRIKHEEIDLAPEFQRRARLWKPHRKGQLIESILLRIPLPVFYVAATDDDMWSVVDGLQRLTTIHDFLSDRFPLSGLEYLHKLEGLYFSKLPRPMQRRIEETSLVLNIIQPGTPDEVMINIFRRLNTGGLPLTGQEIRNALYKGQVRNFLADLVRSEDFQRATDGRVNDDRMDAQECVLRFAAFFLDEWQTYDRNDLDAFLSEAMRKLNALDAHSLQAVRDRFVVAMNAAHAIFGNDAFRKRYNFDDTRKPVSKALFEAWSVNLAKLQDDKLFVLISYRDEIRKQFQYLMANDRFFDASVSSSTGAVQRVHKRFGAIEEIIALVLLNGDTN